MMLSLLNWVFPFEKVEKNEMVIIWGVGVVGKQYIDQVLETNYCRILFAVDKEWENICYRVKINAPEDIKKYKGIKVVIANSSKNIAEEIQNILLSWGVKKCNIIYQIHECSIYKDMYSEFSTIGNYYFKLESILLSIEDFVNKQQIYTKREKEHFDTLLRLLKQKKVVGKQYVRVGNQHDGGYIMLDDFKEGGIAYSFGINNDVSWDKSMAECGYDIYMYDHTINGLPEDNERFHFFKIGIADSVNVIGEELNTLDFFIEQNGHQDCEHMILKMDVEGAEYGFIDMVSEETLLKFDQIVLELHDIIMIDKKEYLERILKKLNKTHQVVHVHGNNYGKIKNIEGYQFTECIEISYVKKELYEFQDVNEQEILLDIDSPCWDRRLDPVFGKKMC